MLKPKKNAHQATMETMYDKQKDSILHQDFIDFAHGPEVRVQTERSDMKSKEREAGARKLLGHDLGEQ